MNADQEILMELRTIKTLLAIDKREELEELTEEFTPVQKYILGLLDPYEWQPIPTSEIADELDIVDQTVRNHRGDLEDRNLVEKQGSGGGAKYRVTGLLGCAELLGLVSLSNSLDMDESNDE